MAGKIHIFDTTLRDGEQSAGVVFTPSKSWKSRSSSSACMSALNRMLAISGRAPAPVRS